MHGGDPELILQSSPDVILWTFTTAKAADDLQKRIGIPVVGIKSGDLGEGRGTFYRPSWINCRSSYA
jgi:ABC-type Fe3+-hydroxamate transport system substrate-binding protein